MSASSAENQLAIPTRPAQTAGRFIVDPASGGEITSGHEGYVPGAAGSATDGSSTASAAVKPRPGPAGKSGTTPI